MGRENSPSVSRLTPYNVSPETDEIEVTLIGPGYGECALIHIGKRRWVIVDSCLDGYGQPAALAYLSDLGLNPSEVVCLVVATHWHDDHIRGMRHVVEMCGDAAFCCASALTEADFLSALAALEGSPATSNGSGARELYEVFSLLAEESRSRSFAISNRVILSRDGCTIWSLSPSDRAFEAFLSRIGSHVPKVLEAKRRVPTLTPNEASVVLFIKVDQTAVLLGADLERRGWQDILDNGQPLDSKASVFKVPHHGSEDAHEDRVWTEMLCESPIAAIAPWRRGRAALPTETDIRRQPLDSKASVFKVPHHGSEDAHEDRVWTEMYEP